MSQLSCSFCGKKQSEVRKLIAGPLVYICDECILLTYTIVEEKFDMTEAELLSAAALSAGMVKAAADLEAAATELKKNCVALALHIQQRSQGQQLELPFRGPEEPPAKPGGGR